MISGIGPIQDPMTTVFSVSEPASCLPGMEPFATLEQRRSRISWRRRPGAIRDRFCYTQAASLPARLQSLRQGESISMTPGAYQEAPARPGGEGTAISLLALLVWITPEVTKQKVAAWGGCPGCPHGLKPSGSSSHVALAVLRWQDA